MDIDRTTLVGCIVTACIIFVGLIEQVPL